MKAILLREAPFLLKVGLSSVETGDGSGTERRNGGCGV